MDPKQDIVPTPDQTGDAARQSRRRLLKAGAVGAPLILTFRSTSAWAVSAGCLIKPGDKPIPGKIKKVDQNGNPIPKDDGKDCKKKKHDDCDHKNGYGDDYETIYVSEEVGDPATAEIDSDRLRAMVYNNNIGQTCLTSIMGH